MINEVVPARKFKAAGFEEKVLATVFWEQMGVIKLEYMSANINSDSYIRTLSIFRGGFALS